MQSVTLAKRQKERNSEKKSLRLVLGALKKKYRSLMWTCCAKVSAHCFFYKHPDFQVICDKRYKGATDPTAKIPGGA